MEGLKHRLPHTDRVVDLVARRIGLVEDPVVRHTGG